LHCECVHFMIGLWLYYYYYYYYIFFIFYIFFICVLCVRFHDNNNNNWWIKLYISPTEGQPCITEERLPTDQRGRVSVRDRRRQSGHRQRPSGHHDMAVQDNGAAVQPVADTAAEPLYLPAGSSRRQSKPPTPPRDYTAPLRFADAVAFT